MKKYLILLFLFSLGCSFNSTFEVSNLTYEMKTDQPKQESPIIIPETTPVPSVTCEGGPTVFSTNMNARYVIGQTNFTNNLANQGGVATSATMNNPIGISVHNGKLYVADAGNNRVLVYNSLPSSDGVSADLVIGQPDFVTTSSGTSDNKLAGIQSISVNDQYLAVAEWSNSRVSLWPLSNPEKSTIVLGQPTFTANTVNNGGVSSKSMGAAAGIGFSSSQLFVGDVTNSRVLIFNLSSLSIFQDAINVIGQSTFSSSGSGSGLTGFGANYSLTTNGSKLAILDNNQDRVLFYNTIPSGNGLPADFEWGGWGVANNKLNNPVGVYMGTDKFFIADRSSDRVLVFNNIPTSSSDLPDAVLGQSNFSSSNHNQCNCSTASANTLWGVHHIVWDGCRLYVTDKQNNRVLVY